MSGPSWLPPEASQRDQSVTSDWQFVDQAPIDGVVVKEVRHVPTHYGFVTELFRSDWALDGGPVDQVFQSVILPGNVSAWHVHEHTTDRLFATHGRLLIALFDGREGSPTHGLVNVHRFGTERPALLVVPPKVWHGVRNDGWEPATLVNAVDRRYAYEAPDHWHVPSGSEVVPYDLLGHRD